MPQCRRLVSSDRLAVQWTLVVLLVQLAVPPVPEAALRLPALLLLLLVLEAARECQTCWSWFCLWTGCLDRRLWCSVRCSGSASMRSRRWWYRSKGQVGSVSLVCR